MQARYATAAARLTVHTGSLMLTLLTVVAALALLALAVGPHIFGYRTLTMLSGSMRPIAAPGDLLVVRPEPISSVRAGQVLTFTAPLSGSPVLTHRVVAVERTPEGPVIRTRGDANPAEDPWRLYLVGDTAWYLVAVVPKLGWSVTALHQPLVWLVAVWLLPLLLCLDALRALWRQQLATLVLRPPHHRCESHQQDAGAAVRDRAHPSRDTGGGPGRLHQRAHLPLRRLFQRDAAATRNGRRHLHPRRRPRLHGDGELDRFPQPVHHWLHDQLGRWVQWFDHRRHESCDGGRAREAHHVHVHDRRHVPQLVQHDADKPGHRLLRQCRSRRPLI